MVTIATPPLTSFRPELTKYANMGCGRTEAVLSSIDQGVFAVDTEDNVCYCNLHAASLLGVDLEKLIGKPYQLLFKQIAELGAEPYKIESELAAALIKLSEHPYTIIVTPYPLPSYLKLAFFPYQIEQYSDVKWVGVIQDVSEEWEQVRQRGETLSQVVSHLRKPMVVVKAYVATLLSSYRYWDVGDQQTFIESMNVSVAEMSELLENLCEVSRLEVGGITLVPRPTKVDLLIRRVVQNLGFRLSGRSFYLELPERLPLISVDTIRTEQVLKNVLEDVIRHSLPKERIEIAARANEGEIVISVHGYSPDTPRDHFDDLYAPLISVSEVNLDWDRESSLGLQIARRLVLMHQGKMWCTNTLNKGPALYFSLPIAFRGDNKPQVVDSQVSQAMRRHNGKRVTRQAVIALVVGDDPTCARLLSSTLKEADFRVLTPVPWSSVLEYAAAEAPDIVIMDVRFPGSQGLDICLRLREFSTMPIIMIAENPKEEDILAGFHAGADDVLSKPFRVKELIARVRTCLRRTWAEQTRIENHLEFGELRIDCSRRIVRLRDQIIDVTRTEYKLLHHLALNAGRVLTHEQLLEAVWGLGCGQQTQYLWVNISRLRKKLEDDPSNPKYICTQPGVGYYLQIQD